MVASEQWIYAQQSVLGSVLISGELAGKLVFNVSADDFTGVYRSIYTAIRDIYTTGGTVDPVTVLHEVGGLDEYRHLIIDLMEITPTAAHLDAYMDVCRRCSRLHRYKEMGEALQQIETVDQAENILASAAQVQIGHGMASWTLAEALEDFFSRYNKRREYLPWFLQQINPKLSLEFGDFCLLGGRPSSGKSAFAIEAAAYWAIVCGYRVGFYSHETSREKLTDRMLAALARVPLDAIKQGTLTDRQLQDVCAVSAKINAAPLDIISCAGRTVAEMKAFALSKRHQIVIVDYLQIVSGPGKDEYSQVSGISKDLHIMCQSLGIFCLALCQLSRTRGARPTVEDLRSSGQLEQDADAILFLHRQEQIPQEREFIIGKNKEGECVTTKLHFDGPKQHFAYLGKGDTPLQGHNYLKAPAYKSLPQSLDQMELLPEETDVPFN